MSLLSNQLKFDHALIDKPEKLDQYHIDWCRLARRGRWPTHRFEWAQSVVACLVPNDAGPLNVLMVRREGRISALAAMQYQKVDDWDMLILLGTLLGEPTDLLYETPADALALLQGMITFRPALVFKRLPAESIVPSLALKLHSSKKCSIKIRSKNAYPSINLLLHPNGELNSGRRSDLRRMRRKSASYGNWWSEVLLPTSKEVPQLFEDFVKIESTTWKANTGWALRYHTDLNRFFRDYLSRIADTGILRVARSWIKDRLAAMQIAVECEGGYWILKITYDSEFRAISPGELLMQDTLQYCAGRQLQSYELMGKVEQWTKMWTSCEYISTSVTLKGFES